MRALVQRVSSASVAVAGEEIAAIGAGILVLLGVSGGDGPAEAERLANKLLKLRIFEDGVGRTSEALGEREILCVSQFTLLADVRKGNRPSFTGAAPPELAKELYDTVCDRLGAERGVFGARMEVALINDGPFTLLVDV